MPLNNIDHSPVTLIDPMNVRAVFVPNEKVSVIRARYDEFIVRADEVHYTNRSIVANRVERVFHTNRL